MKSKLMTNNDGARSLSWFWSPAKRRWRRLTTFAAENGIPIETPLNLRRRKRPELGIALIDLDLASSGSASR